MCVCVCVSLDLKNARLLKRAGSKSVFIAVFQQLHLTKGQCGKTSQSKTSHCRINPPPVLNMNKRQKSGVKQETFLYTTGSLSCLPRQEPEVKLTRGPFSPPYILHVSPSLALLPHHLHSFPSCSFNPPSSLTLQFRSFPSPSARIERRKRPPEVPAWG